MAAFPIKKTMIGAAMLFFSGCVDALNPFHFPESKRDVDGMVLFWMVSGLDLKDSSLACATELKGNTRLNTVKATSGSNWTYCDLGTLSTVDQHSKTWDLRLQRFRISTNSGSSGSGNGGSCDAGTTDFAGVKSSSVCSIELDQEVTSSMGGSGGSEEIKYNGSPALAGWYNYNSATHQLTAKEQVYIIRSSDGLSFYKLQMTDYYDKAGTSGYPAFRWEVL